MSTRGRLEALTAGLMDPSAMQVERPDGEGTKGEGSVVETRFPPIAVGKAAPRTAPGAMLAFRGQLLAVEGEITTLRERLAQFEGSLPTRKLDPALIVPSRWANRHATSFFTPEFARLKTDIEHAGGNVQPIVVRPAEGWQGLYEIVFGHRRHKACSELRLPVLASIWTEPLSDGELFAAMDRENRERADLSPYEQGLMYQRALDEHLYSSQRRLAEALGVSHTWVRKAVAVAQLPQAVIDCFRTPLEIQHRAAEKIGVAIEKDRRLVLKRAEKLRGQKLAGSAIVAQLVDPDAKSEHEQPREIRVGRKVVGLLKREARGAVTIKLNAEAISDERLEQLIEAISRSLG